MSNRTERFSSKIYPRDGGKPMSTSHGAGTAKVRPVNDDFEAKSAEALPVTPAETAPAAAVAPPEKKKSGRRLALPVLALALLATAGWYGHQWWMDGRFMISTDDAYIEGDIASISPKVSGYVAVVNAVANQTVKAGEPLVTLDDGDYRLAREQAEAQIATQKLALGRIDAQIGGARLRTAPRN
jgi:membrane fusion protein (multidrug efflux system)